jgi:hypothetical protein
MPVVLEVVELKKAMNLNLTLSWRGAALRLLSGFTLRGIGRHRKRMKRGPEAAPGAAVLQQRPCYRPPIAGPELEDQVALGGASFRGSPCQ